MLMTLRWIVGGTLCVATLVATLLGALFAGLSEGPHWSMLEGSLPGRSPFTEVRWVGDAAEVEVGGSFYELVSIERIGMAELVDRGREAYGPRWEKRFSEDLVEVLARFGRPALNVVDLELRDLVTGEDVTRREVPMTESNRQSVYLARHVKLQKRPLGEPAALSSPELLAVANASEPGVLGGAGDFEKLSPFTAVRWREEQPEVQFEGRWYRPIRIADESCAELLEFTRETYGRKSQKRFSEDLVQVLSEFGTPPARRIALELEDLETGEVRLVEEALMTEANRRAVWNANQNGAQSEGPSVPLVRVSRAHATVVPSDFVELAPMLAPDAAWNSQTMTRAQAESDLDELEHLLVERFSYLETKGVNYPAAFDAVRLGLGDSVDRNAFAIQVMKLLALFGDGHTRLDESVTRTLPSGYLPFLVGDAGGRAVAFRADRESLVAPEFPYLRSLDGIPVDVWLERAAAIKADGSPQFVRRSAMRTLRYIGYLRRELLVPELPTLSVVLEDESGEGTRELELDLSAGKLNYGDWPRADSEILDGNVGYLRIARMDDEPEFRAELHSAMARFRETAGLVIDVRGNGGGTRDATIELLPYFLDERESPLVVNAAFYRLAPGDDPERTGGYLSNRHLFPPDYAGWSDDVQRVAASFVKGFEPEWQPGSGFAGPHVFVIESERRPYYYGRPVVVLMNPDCFSATDIFLGAFAEAKSVTLLGTPSGGGSGRSRSAQLANSGLRLRLSSMASFRPDGRLYDGRGVEPDVLVEPVATDYTIDTDTVLDAALALLRER